MNTQDHSDYGSRGPAMLARPSKFEPIATGETATGRASQADRLKFSDSHLIDRLLAARQIDALQHEAAQRALEFFTASGIGRSRVARYGETRGTGRESFDDADIDEPTMADIYRKIARRFGYRWAVVEDTLLGNYPGTAKLASLRAALDELCDVWGL